MPFQLSIYLDNNYLYGEWKSKEIINTKYQIYERNHRIQQECWGGYTRHNQLYRKEFNMFDEEIADEYIAENHAIMMYSPLLKK